MVETSSRSGSRDRIRNSRRSGSERREMNYNSRSLDDKRQDRSRSRSRERRRRRSRSRERRRRRSRSRERRRRDRSDSRERRRRRSRSREYKRRDRNDSRERRSRSREYRRQSSISPQKHDRDTNKLKDNNKLDIKSKDTVCYNFRDKGECRFGDRCRFKHTEKIIKEEWGQADDTIDPNAPKEEANFDTSGKLYEHENKKNGVTLKYNEPEDAAIPKKNWRLYVFKNGEQLGEPLHIHRQSSFLIGRNKDVCDIVAAHESISGQHAAIQFRTRESIKSGVKKFVVRPYLIDLESTHGTYINGNKIEVARFVELKNKDLIKFAFSSREYVLLKAS